MAMTGQSYDLHKELAALSAHIMAYNTWYTSVLQILFYPVASAKNMAPQLPPLLVPLFQSPDTLLEIEDRLPLEKAHLALQAEADLLCASPPERGRFKKFTTQYGEFVRDLHSISQMRILELWGLDVLTGLKNKRAMLVDMAQELERVARHGRAFSLALVQIDHYPQILKSLGRELAENIVKDITRLVRASLRSFDGAYYIGHGEFVLSLKQASAAGGQKALERLRNQLDKNDISYDQFGVHKDVTLSCCVAEPLPEDNIEQVLSNLRQDLKTQEREEGAVLVYYEISPLQRFVNSQNQS